MSRGQGAALVNSYEPIKPLDTKLFLDWMGMCEDELWSYIEPHRNLAIWSPTKKNGWARKQTDAFEVEEIDHTQSAKVYDCNFKICNNREPNKPDDEYLTVGKGFVEGKEPNHPIIDRRMPESSGLEKND